MKTILMFIAFFIIGCDAPDCPEDEKLPTCEQHLNFTVCDNLWVCPEDRNYE